MRTNTFIFSWDCLGIEGIVPVEKYRNWDKEQLLNILADRPQVPNPLNGIVRGLILRAQHNQQRHYEIYAVECEASLDEDFWRKQWKSQPQATAELVRERGHCLYNNRQDPSKIKIV